MLGVSHANHPLRRQPDYERRALALLALHLDTSTVGQGDLPYERQTEAESRTLPIAVRALEAIEYALEFCLWDSGAGVRHRDRYPLAAKLRLEADPIAVRSVLDGVIQQVREYLLKPGRIAANPRVRTHCEGELDAAIRGDRRKKVDDRLEHAVELEVRDP